MADRGTCRSCGAAIVWVKTRAGKPCPCDPDPIAIVPVSPAQHVRANPVIAGLDEAGNMVRGLLAEPSSPRVVVTHIRVSHFSTCPSADQHRKERAR